MKFGYERKRLEKFHGKCGGLQGASSNALYSMLSLKYSTDCARHTKFVRIGLALGRNVCHRGTLGVALTEDFCNI
jgi:hypothetical protein